jgi:hypothetical protein
LSSLARCHTCSIPTTTTALAGADLDDAERAAFVARDIRRINALGGYLHLVMSIPGLAAH